jgi:hypothetical protein
METKPGTQTTEFYAMIVAILLPWLATIGDNAGIITYVPERYRWVLPVVASAATAISAGLYAIGRGQAKQGIPYEGAK